MVNLCCTDDVVAEIDTSMGDRHEDDDDDDDVDVKGDDGSVVVFTLSCCVVSLLRGGM